MTYDFFNEHFGQYLVEQSGAPHEAAWRALSANHALARGGQNRIISGWAIIRPGKSSLQHKLAASGIEYDDRTRFQAFADELTRWDGAERMFLTFDKSPIPISNLYLTYDLRAVRICSPAGVETFDYTKEPGPKAGRIHRNIWRARRRNDV